MADASTFSAEENNRTGRSRLVSRAVLVAALIVALLAVLLIFENKKDEAVSVGEGLAPTPVIAPRIGVAVSAPVLSDELKEAIKDAPDSAQQVLVSAAPPAESLPAPPAEGSSDVVTKPVLAPTATEVVQPRTGRSSQNAQSKQGPQGGRSASGVLSPPASGLPAPGSASREAGVFVLQLGVFSNAGNAEELRSRLKLAGIPAQLETRVQVGPFPSKEDAARAQEKLRKLGLDQGMLVTTSKRP